MEEATAASIGLDMTTTKSAWIVAFLLVLASGVLFVITTQHGIGILPDSTRYMRLGPMSYDAPLYTWALDAIRASGVSVGRGARSLGLFLVCANTALIWGMLLRATGRITPSAAGTAIIVLSPQFVGFHAVAMSEPLFLALLFLTIFAFLDYRRTGQQAWLLVSGALFGLTMLARFSAAPMAAVIALVLLFDRRRRLTDRIVAVAWFAVVSGTIFAAWAVTSKLTSGQSVGRDFAFYGNAGPARWLAGLETLTAFLLPEQVPLPVRAAVLLVVVAGIAWLLVRHMRTASATTADIIPIIWGLFAAFYVAFMVLAVTIEANMTINARYMLPCYIGMAICGTSLAARAVGNTAPSALKAVLAGFVALILPGHIIRSAAHAREAQASGVGYASMAWRASPTVAAVRALAPDATIFSNAPDALNFLTPRKTKFIPWREHPRTGRPDPAAPVGDVLARMRAALAAGNGYVVFLDRIDRRYGMSEADLVGTLDLQPIAAEADGRIYGAKRISTP